MKSVHEVPIPIMLLRYCLRGITENADGLYKLCPKEDSTLASWRGHEIAKSVNLAGAELTKIETLFAHADNAGQWKPSNADIENMVSKFLCWKLPIDFTPDGGIDFFVNINPRHWPTGTNLFHSIQVEEMFRHCLNVPLPVPPAATKDE